MQSRLTGAISVLVAQALVLGLGYVTHLWIGRVLGPGPYGIYGIVLSIQSIAGIILTLGVPIAVSRYVAQNNQYAKSILKQALKIQLKVALAVSLITLLIAPLLASSLGDQSLVNFIRFIAGVIFLQAFYQVFIQYLSGMHRFNKQAALTGIYAVLKLIGAITLIYYIDVYGAFAGFAIGGIVAALIGWRWTRHIGGAKYKPLPYKAFLEFAGTYVLILIGLQILISLDLFMVKAFLHDDVQAGYYNASVTIARIPYMLLQALAFVILPSVSALTKHGTSQVQAAAFIRDVLRYLIALIVPGVALAAATSQGLISLFFSTEYLAAAPSLTILIVGLGSLAFYQLLANIVAGAGRARVALTITIIILVVSAIGGYVLVPRFGLMGAAWQTTIAGLTGLILIGTYTFKSFKIPYPYRSTVNILIATAAAVSTTYLWHATALTLLPQYVLALIVYIIVLFIIGEVTTNDRRRLADIHPRLAWLAPKAP